MDLDDLDLDILTDLSRDGRRSFKEIARRHDVSDGTVRLRVARMVESGAVRIAAMQNPFVRAEGISALIGMQLEKRTHRPTMERIARLPGVLSVSNVTGGYDLIVEVYLPSRDGLNTFLFESLAQVDGIRSTETFVLLDAIEKWIPFVPEGSHR
ncbi:MAG: Lrp/AsnC family transcriptional regulator [Alkalispirochaeta sp.]